jgi:hypothetical protein
MLTADPARASQPAANDAPKIAEAAAGGNGQSFAAAPQRDGFAASRNSANVENGAGPHKSGNESERGMTHLSNMPNKSSRAHRKSNNHEYC